jgi:hypothetical protein
MSSNSTQDFLVSFVMKETSRQINDAQNHFKEFFLLLEP